MPPDFPPAQNDLEDLHTGEAIFSEPLSKRRVCAENNPAAHLPPGSEPPFSAACSAAPLCLPDAELTLKLFHTGRQSELLSRIKTQTGKQNAANQKGPVQFMSIEISVVIPTYNRLDTLKEVLPSLLNQTMHPDTYELLLCDAGSTDGTAEYVQSLNDPRLRFLPGPNTGRSGARNRGIDNARGSIVLFTDADIIADPGLLATHAEFHHRNPGHAVVGCEVQVKSLDEYREFSQDPAAHARHKATRKYLPWHYFLTGNASVSRDMLITAGKFDEAFQGYGHEDLELGYRLIKAGVKIYYAPKAVNYHWHPVGFEEQKGRMRLAGHSTVRFYRKYHDLRICLQMGMNPLSMLVHSFLRSNVFILEWLDSLAPRFKLAREIVYQYHYVTGIKEAMGQQ